MTQPWEDELEAVSVLVEPLRRAMYAFVRSAGRPVTREEVAEHVGASVKLAAFHLDKLVEHGWLKARYAETSRPTTGGRPPKLYEPSDRTVQLSLPPRRYDLVGEILLEASQERSRTIAEAAKQSAHDRGRAVGERFRRERRMRRPGPDRTREAAFELLRELGFEPRRNDAGELVLDNCPFRALAEAAPETVCEANRALVEGLLAGIDGTGVEAVSDREGDGCCVRVRPSTG